MDLDRYLMTLRLVPLALAHKPATEAELARLVMQYGTLAKVTRAEAYYVMRSRPVDFLENPRF